ncbi:MAG: molybdate ABC transporter substrate-binding protein [Phascolarctobacterium sp.]|nr:molybdate ABC transporter substrate-binding protein [Phascolarctobacterium sp.]
MKRFLVLTICIMALVSMGCGSDSKKAATPAKEQKTVQLAAAASLEKVFEQQLIPSFTKKHPEIKIQGVYDGSGKLQNQIENGLNADIFISAANKQMQALDKKGYMDSATIKPLLENKLVLFVPAKGDSAIKEFKDIAKAKHPAIGDPASVPAGQYAREALTSLGLWTQVAPKASLGTNVTQVLNWVGEGSADAGLVYATDAALIKDKVKIVAEAPAGSLKKPIIYPMGILKKAPQAVAAQELAAFLQTDDAMQIFNKYGFAKAK